MPADLGRGLVWPTWRDDPGALEPVETNQPRCPRCNDWREICTGPFGSLREPCPDCTGAAASIKEEEMESKPVVFDRDVDHVWGELLGVVPSSVPSGTVREWAKVAVAALRDKQQQGGDS